MHLYTHSLGVDVKWLGLHYDDVFGPNATVPSSALQSWSPADERTHAKVTGVTEQLGNPHFVRELHHMGQHKIKAEIEALNTENFEALETLIIQKVLRKNYF